MIVRRGTRHGTKETLSNRNGPLHKGNGGDEKSFSGRCKGSCQTSLHIYNYFPFRDLLVSSSKFIFCGLFLIMLE
jgi:hypothetical protein